MKIIAYYTEGTPYEEEAKIWAESFKDYDTKIYPVDNCGNWLLNCGQKASVIRNALTDCKDDVLYLDIDARLVNPLRAIPEPDKPGFCLRPIPKDSSLCTDIRKLFVRVKELEVKTHSTDIFLDGPAEGDMVMAPAEVLIDCVRSGFELCSGTMYFPYNEYSFYILDNWIRLQSRIPKEMDQRVLQVVIQKADVPYFKFDLDWLNVDRIIHTANPIIMHTQASRRLRYPVTKNMVTLL